MSHTPDPIKGRGSSSRLAGRFTRTVNEAVPDEHELTELSPPQTELRMDNARTIITRNDSPDVGFSQSINPYRGCEHGCVYCYARPAHAYVDLSPGIDFETKIFFKPQAAALLRKEIGKPGYRCQPIALGVNTDAYQPAERELRVTRSILQVLAECHHPVSLITKSALIERDIDLLAPMAAANLVRVSISVTTLDDELKRRMEPRTASPARRLEVIRRLTGAGIRCAVMAAPMIPALNDHELEAILEAAAAAGALDAGYVLLRLPHEVAPLFDEWLSQHYPLRKSHVLQRLRDMRRGRLNDPGFGTRMRGSGPFAELLDQRFERACRQFGLNDSKDPPLDTTAFRPPATNSAQLGLF
jgi:DNA repair photolyase